MFILGEPWIIRPLCVREMGLDPFQSGECMFTSVLLHRMLGLHCQASPLCAKHVSPLVTMPTLMPLNSADESLSCRWALSNQLKTFWENILTSLLLVDVIFFFWCCFHALIYCAMTWMPFKHNPALHTSWNLIFFPWIGGPCLISWRLCEKTDWPSWTKRKFCLQEAFGLWLRL